MKIFCSNKNFLVSMGRYSKCLFLGQQLVLFNNLQTILVAYFRRRRALTKEEKFNHAHAQLRNVIERAYGVLKVRFPILKQMAPYPFPVPRNVVIACFAVHNFIRSVIFMINFSLNAMKILRLLKKNMKKVKKKKKKQLTITVVK